MKSFLSTQQVADLTGKHPETIRRWCRSGKLKAIKKGRDYLVPVSEFEIKKTDAEQTQNIIDFVFRSAV